jgi:hypothetical protein
VQGLRELAQREKESLQKVRESTRFEQLSGNALYRDHWEQILQQEAEAANEIDKNLDLFVRQLIDIIVGYRKSEDLIRRVR